MHWLAVAARRLALKGAESVTIPDDSSLPDAWNITSRALGISSDQLVGLLAPALNLPEADFPAADPRALAFIPERLARQLHVFPLREEKRQIVVATADPANIGLEQAIGFATGRRPVLHLASPQAI